MYYHGTHGVHQNHSKALKWYQSAAKGPAQRSGQRNAQQLSSRPAPRTDPCLDVRHLLAKRREKLSKFEVLRQVRRPVVRVLVSEQLMSTRHALPGSFGPPPKTNLKKIAAYEARRKQGK